MLRLYPRAEIEQVVGSVAFRSFQIKYRGDPVGFVRDCIRWRDDEGPTLYQEEILAALVAQRRVAVRGPHGLGKTALAAWSVLWFSLTRDGDDWKVVTTASAWRQLTKYLWPEVRKWARRLRWDRIGREPLDRRAELLSLSLKLRTGEAFAVASDTPDLIEGAHAANLLYVFDEAKAIPSATWDAAEGALAAGDCYALAISTPGEPQGRFYEIHSRKPGYEDWWVRHVTLDEAVAAGRVSRVWAEQRRRQWGEASPIYQNRVLGEFATSAEDTVIPLAWAEAANERWLAWKELGGQLPSRITAVGVDVGRGGDKTVLVLRYGEIVSEVRKFGKANVMDAAGRIAGVLRGHGGRAVVDVIGIGAGVVDRLREQGFDVVAFNAAERTDVTDRSGELGFVNKRAAAWWHLRELLDPSSGAGIALPPDDELIGDLTAPRWKVVSGGKIQIESKDDIRKRLGRSTDVGDAAVMAFWYEPKTKVAGGFMF
ncbi:MAG TPA: hypothetical protein EYH32_01280 [Anaerolineae bacterium]|nr:hypothetical protein [Anaerolineae bacterium]